MTTKRFIVWFRNDLRIHDNEVLSRVAAYAASKDVLPVYCFDPRMVSGLQVHSHCVHLDD
jgi:deoxyribodipyrimidine photo-lyase